MPYIQKELRLPIFDTINTDILTDTINETEYAEILENTLIEKNIPQEKWDAIINYVLSKLLQNKDFHPFFVVHRIYIQFFEEHGYYGRERFVGLLTLMFAEFKRRGWNPKARAFLVKQIELYARIISEYERRKMEENGDIL